MMTIYKLKKDIPPCGGVYPGSTPPAALASAAAPGTPGTSGTSRSRAWQDKPMTEKQRKYFHGLCRTVGYQKAHDILEDITGVRSVSGGMEITTREMSRVLTQLNVLHRAAIRNQQTKPKPKRYRRPLDIAYDLARGDNIISLTTNKQKTLIAELQKQVGFSYDDLQAYCQRIIKRKFPLTIPEAQAIIAGLKAMVKVKWNAKR